jgi:hypothetical protein
MQRDHLEALGVDSRTIMKWMLKELDGGIDWIDLVQGSTSGGLLGME